MTDEGGLLLPVALAVNDTGRPERVLSAEQMQALDDLVRYLDEEEGGQ